MTPDPIDQQSSKNGDSEGTGLPVLSTWPAVYIFVLTVFILLVILLTLFTRAYA